MKTVFHAWLYGRFVEIQSTLRRKKLHTRNQGSNFPGGNFSNRYNIRAKSNLNEKANPSIFKMIFPQQQTHPFSHQ